MTATVNNMTIKYVKEEAGKELVTKQDFMQGMTDIDRKFAHVDLKFAELRHETFRFIVRTGIGVVISLGGFLGSMMAHGFHWI